MASCARRGFAAETMRMARVICCVFLMEVILRLMSRSEGTVTSRVHDEDVAEGGERLVELLPDLPVELLLVQDEARDLRVLGVDELEQFAHVALHLVHRDVADPAD